MDGSTGTLARLAGAAALTAAMLIPTSESVSGAATISGGSAWAPSTIDRTCAVKYMAETHLLLEMCQNGTKVATEVDDPQLQDFLKTAQDRSNGDKPLPVYSGRISQKIPGLTSSITPQPSTR